MSQATRDVTADLEAQFIGDRYAVAVGPVLQETGWVGGLFVTYVPPIVGEPDDFVVEVSDGNAAAGFTLFPSENYPLDTSWVNNWDTSQNYTSFQNRTELSVSGSNTITIVGGGGRYLFKHYETQQLVLGQRTGPPIVYALNDVLKVSENGLLTNDSDVDLATVGITTPQAIGICCAVPAQRNNFRLGLHYRF